MCKQNAPSEVCTWLVKFKDMGVSLMVCECAMCVVCVEKEQEQVWVGMYGYVEQVCKENRYVVEGEQVII